MSLSRLTFLFFSLLIGPGTLAQSTASNSINVKGQIIDKSTEQPVEFATVTAYQTKDSTLLGGIVTNAEGNFQFTVPHADIYLNVQFIGYEKRPVFNRPELVDGELNYKTIPLQADDHLLNDVTVTGEKSEMVFKLDKRVFNVGKDLSNSGGSAVDVLNNVPSVDVNLEGTVSLRGNSNVQILINGKPSVLANGTTNALGTISADMIERVEVITNPSAKYDAEGTTGILNIVLKKDTKKGLNGSVTLNTGYPNNHSLGLSVNYRTEKFNIFSQVGIGKRTFVSEGTSESTSINDTNTTTLHTVSEGEKNERFANILLGSDFYLNPYNTITLSGHYAYELEDQYASLNYDLSGSDNISTSTFSRDETTRATNPKWQYDLQHHKTFKRDKEQTLTTSFTGSFFGKDKRSDFANTILTGTSSSQNQQSRIDFKDAGYTFQSDYIHPFNKKHQLETGAKYDLGTVANTYQLENQVDDAWEIDPLFTSTFDYRLNVLAAYTTYAYEGEKAGIKTGLRYEQTSLSATAESTTLLAQDYGNWFPSVHTSYKFNKRLSAQLGYSRRIQRPDLFELSPFFSFTDNFNLFAGNPELQPEFSNVFELTTIAHAEKMSANVSLFHSRTTDVIDEIIRVENNVSISLSENIGQSYNTGLEFNGKYTPNKWFSLSTDLNFTYFQREGNYDTISFDFTNYRWSARANTKFKLAYDIDLQISLRYQSKVQHVFTTQLAYYYMDAGIRKKILKGKAIINLSVRDVFASRVQRSIAEQPTFAFSNSRQRGRYTVLGFSYSFGKGEAMEFSGHKAF